MAGMTRISYHTNAYYMSQSVPKDNSQNNVEWATKFA